MSTWTVIRKIIALLLKSLSEQRLFPLNIVVSVCRVVLFPHPLLTPPFVSHLHSHYADSMLSIQRNRIIRVQDRETTKQLVFLVVVVEQHISHLIYSDLFKSICLPHSTFTTRRLLLFMRGRRHRMYGAAWCCWLKQKSNSVEGVSVAYLFRYGILLSRITIESTTLLHSFACGTDKRMSLVAAVTVYTTIR